MQVSSLAAVEALLKERGVHYVKQCIIEEEGVKVHQVRHGAQPCTRGGPGGRFASALQRLHAAEGSVDAVARFAGRISLLAAWRNPFPHC